MAHNAAAFDPGEHTCCGVVQEAKYHARQKRAQRQSTPQPWIVLKFALIVTVGIIVYASYVYIDRFCVPMLRRDSNALGNRTYGVVFLAVFSVLLVMTFWCYAKVAFTSPGHAKNHVSRSPRPLAQSWGSNTELSGIPYEYQIDSPAAAQLPSSSGEKAEATMPRMSDYTRSHITDPSTIRNKRSSLYARRPPTTSALLPEYRYCTREGIVKPYRAHHCRACGYCILKYDHHCPWIGQCVGARNHKFFVNFVQWAFLYCAWIFATLIALNVRPKSVSLSRIVTDIDPQHIAVMALSGFFGLFTGTLVVTHIRLICLNLSTLEHVKIIHMQENETAILGEMFSCWEFRQKQRTVREWDEQWGDLSTEGNIWWLGSSRKNWESVMGKNIWGWFLPIGRSESDGLDYPINPRFDRDGRWRRRTEWPDGLR